MRHRERIRKDFYYKKAKAEGYRSRAAYKLKQINDKFRIIKEGDIVIDLGAAPGGWIQVAHEIVGEKGFILGVDIEYIKPLPWDNIRILQEDITDPAIGEKIKIKLTKEKADVILSDLSPKVSGNWNLDHEKQIYLSEKALEIALKVLKKRGHFLTKIFQGRTADDFILKMKRGFKYVRLFKPMASRKRSAEIYVIAKWKT